MATASFAAGSVFVAVVWGTFFYPPPPKDQRDAAIAPAVFAPVPHRTAVPVAHTPPASPHKHPAVVSQLGAPTLIQLSSK